MSEKTKADLVLEKIESLEKQFQTGLNELKAAKAAVPSEIHEHAAMPESAKGHRTIDEVADCPNCKPKLIEKFRPQIEKELRPALLKEFSAKLKSKDLVTCDDCGEIVEKTETECPSCHGRKAH